MTFVGLPEGATVAIGGLIAQAGQPLMLAPGPYTYTAEIAGWCPLHGVVQLSAGAAERIQLVEKDWRFPQVRFKVNKHKIRIQMGGETYRGGEWITLKNRCSGEEPYKAWLYKQKQVGVMTLRPGAEVEIAVNLLDPETVRDLVKRARTQRQGHRASLSFGLGVPTGANQDLRLMYVSALRYHWSVSFLRLGGGLQLGFGNGFGIEAFGSAMLQMTDLGNSSPLHIRGLVTLVPFLGAEMGLGYQSINDIAGTARSNFRVDKDDSIMTNIGVLRFVGGVTVPISDVLAAELRASWDVNMASLLQFGIGLSGRFM